MEVSLVPLRIGRKQHTATCLAIFLLLATGNSLQAQLRTGSSGRSFYRPPPVREAASEAPSESPAAAESSTRSHASQVQLAGCTSCAAGGMEVSIPTAAIHQNDAQVIDETTDTFNLNQADLHGSTDCTACDSGFEHSSTACDSGVCHNLGQCGGSTYFCGPGPLQSLLRRLSIRAEVPLFWRRGHSTPALVTTAPEGTGSDVAGQLGRNTTEILQGGVFGQDAQAGFRITLGTFLDDCQDYGVLFRYWNAGNRRDSNSFDSDSFPILARPFLNTSDTPAQDTQLIAFPGDSVGNIQVVGRSEVYGIDVNLRRMWYADRFTRIDWLYGYQHAMIGERLRIDSETTVIGNVPPIQGSTISVSDQFRAENSFHGSTVGFLWNRRVACFQFENMIRLALGNLRREVQVSGETTTTSSGTTNTVNEGLLARGTNSRTFIDDAFVIAPEVGINLAWALNPYMDFTIGYNYQMIPKVFQAGRLIDPQLRVNLSDPLTGSLDPGFRTRETRYWVRSLGLGLQVRY